MTTRNFRVNNGLEVGDITISASANTITGGATAAPSSDGDFSNKKYVDDQDALIASDTLTFTNKTLDANGTGNNLSNIDSGNFLSGFFLDEDNMSTNSNTAVASQQSIKAYVDSEISNIGGTGDLSFTGSTISAPSNADVTITSSNGNVVIEGLRIAGTTISTEDSTPGVEIAGNLIPSQDGVFQLGSSSKRWQTAFLSAETIDLGGATISSDGTGTINIAASGATLPEGSKVSENPIALLGATTGTAVRPIQKVQIFVSDGSTNKTDAQFLAGTADLTLEFNATVEDVPVYTDAQQTFTLSNGDTLASNAAGITLFQF